MVKGITNARFFLQENSGGGDKVWVEKDLGAPEIVGDKVFIKKNYKGDLDIDLSLTNVKATSAYCYNDGSVVVHTTGNVFYRYHFKNGVYIYSRILGSPTASRKYHKTKRFGENVVFYADDSLSDGKTYDIVVGKTTITGIVGKFLREDLVLQRYDTSTYNLVRYDLETNTYGEILGSISLSSQSVSDLVLDENILFISTTNGSLNFYDISDLYNPILLNSQKPNAIKSKIYCATGLNVGDYVITSGSANLSEYTADSTFVYQIKEGYVLGDAKDINDRIVRLLSNVSAICYNDENKVLSIGSNFFKYENGEFCEFPMRPLLLMAKNSNSSETFIVSENLETSARVFNTTVSGSSGYYINFYHRNSLNANWITCSLSSLTSDVYSGVFTGNIDEFDRVEVKALLPDKVNLTVITNIDVKGNEIMFEGVAE